MDILFLHFMYLRFHLVVIFAKRLRFWFCIGKLFVNTYFINKKFTFLLIFNNFFLSWVISVRLFSSPNSLDIDLEFGSKWLGFIKSLCNSDGFFAILSIVRSSLTWHLSYVKWIILSWMEKSWRINRAIWKIKLKCHPYMTGFLHSG